MRIYTASKFTFDDIRTNLASYGEFVVVSLYLGIDSIYLQTQDWKLQYSPV